MNTNQIANEIISLIKDKNKHKKQRNFFAVGLIVLIIITLIIHFATPTQTNDWYFWVPCVLIWIAWVISYVLYVIFMNKEFIKLKIALEQEQKIIATNKVKLLQKLFYFRNNNKVSHNLIVEEMIVITKNNQSKN